jgi:hypothetical protein
MVKTAKRNSMVSISIKKKAILIAFVLFPFFCSSQTFETFSDSLYKETTIRYYHRAIGVLIQKIYPADNPPYFELALILTRRSNSSEDILKKGGIIYFEDKTYIFLKEPNNIIYASEGKYHYSIKHLLTAAEFEQLKIKKIDFFKVADKEEKLDKWQPSELLKAFQGIDKKQ